ncbi:MAG: hypothetical protein N4J56_004626 [Chroococcidiopsis sp. SAG 2025]|uniref:hypothetical protein n=1 Tax=Chroococcidiopsis sp. SAG 2025 TaxID=171389 RepID=UPI002936FC1B|nr:hypothetical protein [Chroococcidiopsis sp. SAG 2025]MDV2994972.1 hypothetical protein [Chroococcidiopsis sp. SAG 2025]
MNEFFYDMLYFAVHFGDPCGDFNNSKYILYLQETEDEVTLTFHHADKTVTATVSTFEEDLDNSRSIEITYALKNLDDLERALEVYGGVTEYKSQRASDGLRAALYIAKIADLDPTTIRKLIYETYSMGAIPM